MTEAPKDEDHTMTLRTSKELAEDLSATAAVVGISVSKLAREMLYKGIKAKRADPEFQRRLTASLKRNAVVLERLRHHD